ncbi:hypothetical protein MD588_24390 [Photobacterium sp. SDRW27]|uniref:gamma-mobile-trio integrase GmtZ n=1 Tax=Photobacterium obscurum TaxID=2829490 RepID=UPI002243B8CC|nr:VPA1269 family protein [Photobacterium obscurum]MCW8331941.1 hypothetical protein [Photobacterium obscurum]
MNRSDDMEFLWFTDKFGSGWDTWRELASTYLLQKNFGVDRTRTALSRFLEAYLVPQFITDPVELFQSKLQPYNEFLQQFELSEGYQVRLNNEVSQFVDWVLATYYSEPDDNGDLIPLFSNPFNMEGNSTPKQETVYNTLPYAYIKRLRQQLCPRPNGNFRDWVWAIAQSKAIESSSRHLKDWILVDKSEINVDDQDCVWQAIKLDKDRTIDVDGIKRSYKSGETLYFIWSPVRAMAVYLKLQLPLRTFQVRMLDSGEADTWRYQSQNWVLNDKHSFVEGTEKRPWQKGVFHRIKTPDIGDIMTGLYINTNKTADRNKDELSRGYVIPWQHGEVLYWLEKLRNWQEKYNPLTQPTSIHSLKYKHFGSTKTTVQREAIGDICFLFRNAAATLLNERHFPITDGMINHLWIALLKFFEGQLFEEGTALSNGDKICFVDPSNARKSLFPTHSLRVSLITCYMLEGEIPAPVLSKLLVGHSRLMMTMHYTKVTPVMMAKKMRKAEEKINDQQDESLQTFLACQSLEQIELQTASNDLVSIANVLRVKNPAGWQEKHIGLCLVGGNTSRIEANTSLGGCWNGGEKLKKANRNQPDLYGPVPHGSENCIRCRWFITDIRYLHVLTAHFNNLSYQATQAAKLATELEAKQDALLDEEYFCEVNKQTFMKYHELHTLDRRIEKQRVEADEYCKDLVACFQIIRKLIKLEQDRTESDNTQKVIAIGSLHDIFPHFNFFETTSEFRQLIKLCDDAEIYHDLRDELTKTSAITQRSNYLNKVLMQSGYMPVFMNMDEETQLLAGNAMVNAMMNKTGIKDSEQAQGKVAEYIETGQCLVEAGLLEAGIEAMEKQTQLSMIRLSDLNATGAIGGGANERNRKA